MTAMPIPGPVPEWLLSAVAALTLFAVMFDLGLIIVPGEFRWVAERPSLMAKALFAVVVAVPAIAWAVARVMDLPRAAEIGIMLMAIAPGAPVALRNALVAGGHRAFAPALQISLAIVAIASMPLFVAAFDEYYAGEASVDPRHLARQVFFAQLLPLALGVATMRLWPAAAGSVEPALRKAATLLLVLLAVLALAGVWEIVIGAGWRVIAAIVLTSALAIAVGHALGGPAPATRTATAVSSAARNTGLALLVASLNNASPAIIAAVVAYFVASALTLVPYVFWRRRRQAQPAMVQPGEAK
jgi:BASS family bile acid:Na+ symporter